MAWNEPGGGNRDPWSGGGREQGPPDLDAIIRKLSDKLSLLLGGRRGGNSGGNGPGGSGSGFVGIGLIIGVIAVIGWLIASIYIVNEGERGVVLRFGRYLETTLPGPHLRLFPIDRVEIVNLEQRRFREIGYRSGSGGARQPAVRTVPKEALMLTQDENIVDVRMAVQYQISDPRAYLFSVLDPEGVLVQVVESAARETIGKSTMDFVLTEGRSTVVADIKTLSQRILNSYDAGLHIVTVVLQDAQPPEEVQDAFADAIKAREDEQRLKNEAEAYSNEVIPRARGQSARRLQEASAYKEQVIAQAQGEASRFDQLQAAYQKAPEITRERLYLETLEAVLSRSSKVLVDVKGTNNLLYLPLDRLLKSGETPPAAGSSAAGGPVTEVLPASSSTSVDGSAAASRLRDLNRSREVR
ncbi:MAG: FtsH protease activity modulator HflK [Candidatus Competibacteraceae bacterium]|uniref:Protein HflK n=1 Tax=Candidatus Contendobacter odensis Run_B_J11 TaxID=1400861 RepID=A0A7U7G8S6_9GAMM|nr:FtsH protease activity modulator HflK [Candidatus Contendobacter odensis]MBK8535905.1 FtsH protease activity modulator HflK [Candidatus Competibacteraceae bacterium]MBK8750368.1 FtsH protease activity modulator HflK [Candidatus Competibacteraceae bacterium]CDH43700.1 with HflC, part of modulator for protease specific for FtsH phage lambda cII repressor [Candidatus Contendobacter odensis Run_B_J11]